MRTLDSKDVVDEFENLIDKLVDPVLLRHLSNAAILVHPRRFGWKCNGRLASF